MLATVPVDEMARTLRVLAGENAVNAARHFTRYSYCLGDAGAVALWSRAIQALAEGPAAPKRPAVLVAEALTPSRLAREQTALLGVRYEDIDTATLALEEPPAIVVRSLREWTGERHGFARSGAAPARRVAAAA